MRLLHIVSLLPAALGGIIDESIQSNELLPKESIRSESLPMCEGNSICGFLQANYKGLTHVAYCNCQGRSTCSGQWDQLDGQSITQAKSDQYKYCGRAPKVPVCRSAKQVAYTSVQKYLGDDKIAMKDELHCSCPFGSSYQDTKFDIKDVGPYEVWEIAYYCMPLKQCNGTETCKDITEKPGQYIVNPKCLCGEDKVCPSMSYRNGETQRLGNSYLHRVQCEASPGARGGQRYGHAAHRLTDLYRQRQAGRQQASRVNAASEGTGSSAGDYYTDMLEADIDYDMKQQQQQDGGLKKRSMTGGVRYPRWGPALGLFGTW